MEELNKNIKKETNIVKNNVNINKNDEFQVDIIDYGADGEGIAKINGYTIFVKGALKDEICIIHITKVLKNYAYANIKEILKKSIYRNEIDCSTYPKCGGCALRHIDYEETLRIKQEKVQNLIDKVFKNDLKNKIIVQKTIGMEDPFYYRNKAIYPIDKEKNIGIYASRSHNIIPISECKIQTLQSQKIAKYIAKNWNGTIYNEKTGKGILRNIMIRESFSSGDIMCVLVQNGSKNVLNIEDLVNKFPKIKTIIINVNTENTNVVLSKNNIIVYGDGYITDNLGEYKFRISPNSFYQINSRQTEKIYKIAIEKAKLNKNDVLCDLYCGIGTIGIFASKYVKKVYGIEIVKDAIEDAKINAKINNIGNIEFIEGDVEKAFDFLIKNKFSSNNMQIKNENKTMYDESDKHVNKEKDEFKIIDKKCNDIDKFEVNKSEIPNVVIVDPPRKGLDNITINNLKKLNLQRIVYVSCNPATLARDLKELSEIYEINDITPVDNFCFSSHVETITTLTRKS